MGMHRLHRFSQGQVLGGTARVCLAIVYGTNCRGLDQRRGHRRGQVAHGRGAHGSGLPRALGAAHGRASGGAHSRTTRSPTVRTARAVRSIRDGADVIHSIREHTREASVAARPANATSWCKRRAHAAAGDRQATDERGAHGSGLPRALGAAHGLAHGGAHSLPTRSPAVRTARTVKPIRHGADMAHTVRQHTRETSVAAWPWPWARCITVRARAHMP